MREQPGTVDSKLETGDPEGRKSANIQGRLIPDLGDIQELSGEEWSGEEWSGAREPSPQSGTGPLIEQVPVHIRLLALVAFRTAQDQSKR